MGVFTGTTRMGIGLTITMVDRFSAVAAKVDRGIVGLGQTLGGLERQQSAAMMAVGGAMAIAGAGILRGYSSMIGAAMEYQYTMAGVAAVTRDQTATLDELDKKATQVAANTMYTLDNVASAMKFMGMAGVSRKDIIGTIDAVAGLGAATDHMIEGKGGTADIMTNIMKAFNIEATKSARVSDILAAGTLSANTNIADLGEAIKYTSATAMDLNVELEETVAMIMAMGNAGIQASMAGTAVENMLRYITTATGERSTKGDQWAFEKLGISPTQLKDAHGNLKPIGDILGTIRSGLEGLGTTEKQTILTELFGVRGKRAGSLLIRELDSYKTFLNDMNNLEPGYALEVAAKRLDNIKGDVLLLTSAWSILQKKFTDSMEWLVRPLLQFGKVLVDIVSYILGIPILGSIITGLGGALGIVLTVAGGFLLVLGSISFLINQMTMAMGALATINVTSWALSTTAAGVYLKTLYGILTAQGMTVTGMFRGAGGRFAGNINSAGPFKQFIYQVGLAWRNYVLPAFQFVWRLVTGIGKFLAPAIGAVGMFVGILGAVAGVGYLLSLAFQRLNNWIDRWLVKLGIVDDTSDESRRGVDLSGSTRVSMEDYLKDPESFKKGGMHITHQRGMGFQIAQPESSSKDNGETTLNIYLDGEKSLSKKIRRGDREDLYQELGGL
jgi:TP901 family phage tail tape measure protein